MCEADAHCPACDDDLRSQEVYCGTNGLGSPMHIFHCQCGVRTTVTEPVPGLVQTRQDATYQE